MHHENTSPLWKHLSDHSGIHLDNDISLHHAASVHHHTGFEIKHTLMYWGHGYLWVLHIYHYIFYLIFIELFHYFKQHLLTCPTSIQLLSFPKFPITKHMGHSQYLIFSSNQNCLPGWFDPSVVYLVSDAVVLPSAMLIKARAVDLFDLTWHLIN